MFGDGGVFKVSIEVLENEYKISFNDEEIAERFPQRNVIESVDDGNIDSL